MPDAPSITLLLRDLANGDRGALDSLIPLVYDELRKIAKGQLRRERPGHTLQPTALVHEVYSRMMGGEQPDYRNRAHFLAIASRAMRKILIDYARIRNADKRGGADRSQLSLNEACNSPIDQPHIMVALDDALSGLEQHDPLKAQLIEMRYFGGLTAQESADVLNLEVEVVRRELRLAQAWLQRELNRSAGN